MIFLEILFFGLIVIIILGLLWLISRSNFVHWIESRKKAPIYVTLDNRVQYKLRIKVIQFQLLKTRHFNITLLRRYGFFPIRFWLNGFGLYKVYLSESWIIDPRSGPLRAKFDGDTIEKFR